MDIVVQILFALAVAFFGVLFIGVIVMVVDAVKGRKNGKRN